MCHKVRVDHMLKSAEADIPEGHKLAWEARMGWKQQEAELCREEHKRLRQPQEQAST